MGFVVAMIIVVFALGVVSEIVLPLTFAAVLAVVFKPLVGVLERHRLKPTIAAGLVGLLAVVECWQRSSPSRPWMSAGGAPTTEFDSGRSVRRRDLRRPALLVTQSV